MISSDQSLHLCLVCGEYPPAPHGGIGSYSEDLAESLVAAGHRVTVVGMYQGGSGQREDRNGVAVVRLRRASERLPYRFRQWWDRQRLRKWLMLENRASRFSIVEVADFEGWIPWRVPGVPVVVRIHGSNLYFDRELNRQGDPTEHGFEERTLKSADAWVGVSQYALKRTREYCHWQTALDEVIYNAVDTDLFSPGTASEVEAKLIVFVNAVIPKKGIEQLIDAVNLVGLNHPETRLAVIGATPAPRPGGRSYRDELQARISPAMQARVSFLGRLDRNPGVISWLRKATLCCYPSNMETFGIAPVEAMSVGKPTIYSKVGPGPEVIADGNSGLLCDPADPRDIASKIEHLFANPQLAERIGANARKRVLQLFDRRSWISKNVDFYSKCIAHIGQSGR